MKTLVLNTLGKESQTVAHLLPVYQVFAMEHRHAREVLEGAVHQIEVIAHTADAGVGMKARKYGVFISLCRCSEGKEKHADD